MATAQLTAFSISVSARNLSSFEGLRASNVNFASFKPAGGFALSRRPLRCLVVQAATVVAPKVKMNSLNVCLGAVCRNFWLYKMV